MKQLVQQIEMEMWIYLLYQNEINFFEKKADELFVEIIIHETKMEQRKQQKLQPNEGDVNQLYKMIISMLKMIAIIETYRYFQLKKILLTNQNLRLFFVKKDEHFENLLLVFLLKIKNEQSIDFTIL